MANNPEKNKERDRKSSKKWRKKNPEKSRECVKWYNDPHNKITRLHRKEMKK